MSEVCVNHASDGRPSQRPAVNERQRIPEASLFLFVTTTPGSACAVAQTLSRRLVKSSGPVQSQALDGLLFFFKCFLGKLRVLVGIHVDHRLVILVQRGNHCRVLQ